MIRTDEELRNLYFTDSGVWPDNVIGAIDAEHLRSGVLDTYDTLNDFMGDNTDIFSYNKKLYVSKNGNDISGDGSFHAPYATFSFANAAASGTPTERVIIEGGPGWFVETNPINTKAFVNIKGQAPNSTVIVAASTAHLINLNENVYIANLGFVAHDDYYAINIIGSGLCAMENVAFLGGSGGILIDGVDARVSASNIKGVSSESACLIDVKAGELDAYNVEVPEIGYYRDSIMSIDGPNATIHSWTYNDESPAGSKSISITNFGVGNFRGGRITGKDYGFYAEDSYFLLDGYTMIGNATGVYMPTGTTRSGLSNITLTGNQMDVYLQCSGGLTFSGSANADLVQVTNTDLNIIGSFLNTKPGDEGLNVLGELHVGTANRPAESTFGGGDSYNDNMLVYTSGVAEGVTNVTAIAQSNSGSSFPLPSGVGDTMYLCSTKIEGDSFHSIHGIKITISSPVHAADEAQYDATVTGGTIADGDYDVYDTFGGEALYKEDTSDYYIFYAQGYWCMYDALPASNFKRRDADYVSIILEGDYDAQNGNSGTPTLDYNERTENPDGWEYFNSIAGWTAFGTMGTKSDGRYLPVKEVASIIGSHQIRFDARLNDSFEWDESDPFGLGESHYWVRVIMGDNLTDPGGIEQIKLHTSRTEINSDGFVEYFGKGRPVGKLPWTKEQIKPTSLGNLSDVDLYLSDNIVIGGDENGFSAGQNAGFGSTMPDDMDTSTPVNFGLTVRPAATGTVLYTIRWTYAEPGSLIFISTAGPATHVNEQSLSGSLAVGVGQIITISELLSFTGSISRRDHGAGDIIAVSFEQTGGPAIALIDVSGRYLRWCSGGHIGV